MLTRTPPILVWLCLTASMYGQGASTYGQAPLAPRVAHLLPSNSRIIEIANVPSTGKPRALVLWMTAPRLVMSHWDSAFNLLYGDHWFGPEFLFSSIRQPVD